MLATIKKDETAEGVKQTNIENGIVSFVALSDHPGTDPDLDRTAIMSGVADYSNVSQSELIRRAFEHDVIKMRKLFQKCDNEEKLKEFAETVHDMEQFDKKTPKTKVVSTSEAIAKIESLSDADRLAILEQLSASLEPQE